MLSYPLTNFEIQKILSEQIYIVFIQEVIDLKQKTGYV